MGTGATADFPNLIVEWLPGQGANATNGTWVDITDYVRGIRIKRGRQYEIDQFQTGQCDLDMVATSRLFDPENTAGTYYGQLVPMRQVRVTSVWAATTYSLFRGYITDFGQTIVDDKLFTSQWTARDAFLRLEQKKLPSSAWALEVVQDDPSAWFRLGETNTVRLTDSSDGGNYGLYDNCTQGVEGLVVNDADGAASFNHSGGERVVIQNPSLISGYPFSMSWLAKVDDSDPDGAKALFTAWVKQSPVQVGLYAALSGGGIIVTWISQESPYLTFIKYSVQRVDDNKPHHIVWTVTNASTQALYIDGVLDAQTTITSDSPAFPGPIPGGYSVGNWVDVDYPSTVWGFGTENAPGTIDEFCVWNGTALGATRIAAQSLAALEGWDGDDTGARVTRFLDAIGWPSELRSIATGISVLGPASWSAGDSALSVMQAWADTELGQFFADRDGKIVWRSRHYPYLNTRSTSSQASFVDGHTNGTLVDDIVMVRDEALIRNPVQASRAGGVSVVVSDTTYVDKYGDRTWNSPTTQDQADASVRDRAVWLLGRYKELGTRLPSLELFPRRNPGTLWPYALGLDIGDRITVKRQPLGLNNVISIDQIIEGVEHVGSPMQWTTRFTGSPVDPGVNTYLILDDATYGKLDTAKVAY